MIGRNALNLQGARFSPFVRAQWAHFQFYLHIFHQAAQIKVDTEKQLPRFPRNDAVTLHKKL